MDWNADAKHLEPYSKGLDAGHAWWGADREMPDNPYPARSQDWHQWDLGFHHGTSDAEIAEEG